MACNYKNDGICKLFSVINNKFTYVPNSFCNNECGDTDEARLKMLSGRDIFDFDLADVEAGYQAIVDGVSKREEELKAERQRVKEKLKAERQRLLTELPNGFKLAENLIRHLAVIAVYYKETGRLKVSPEQEYARLAVCRHCPDGKMIIKDDVMRCVICGCHMNNAKNRKALPLGGKAEYEVLTCDLGHWAEIDKEYEVK